MRKLISITIFLTLGICFAGCGGGLGSTADSISHVDSAYQNYGDE